MSETRGDALRMTMGRFATGVAVVTTIADRVPHGMTVNSLTSVSLDPPLLLVSLMLDARTTDAVTRSGRFAASVVSSRQEHIARRFARGGTDHFDGLPLEYGAHDVPVVPGALAHLECATERVVPAGDHVLFIGHILRTCARDGDPLTFYGGTFGEFSVRDAGRIDWFC
jgi:flavin reductase (DIM6/NTAB) family NADH-FMN oxidoreductase RutF